jgi:hypothetical protein
LTMSTTAGLGGLWLTGETPAFPEAPGTVVTVGIAVWYNGGGTLTLAQAEAISGDPYGFSPTGNVTLGGGSLPVPDLPGGPGEIQSFSMVTPTPEPSTIALGVMGASAFLIRLRRKQ